MILRNSISAFSVLLIMAATAVVGLMTVPFLRVQYAPPTSAHVISVTFSMPGASASVIEEEVTSLIEGVLAGVSHCRGIRSVSRIGRGRVNVSFDKNTDMAAARFEVASRIRSIRDKLPECCSYPDISLSTDGLPRRTAIVYYIRSARTSESIASVSKKLLQEPLSCIEGVSSVILSGNIGFHQVITFDANACEVYGVSPSEVAAHLREAYSSKPLWRASEGSDTYNICLKTLFDGNIEDIPVAVKDNRVVRLGDIASVRVEEEEPESYFRLNGLNAVSLSVVVSDESNLLKVVEEVRSKVEEIRKGIPDDMSISVGYDYSEYLDSELNKIYRRTALCVMILLLLVFLTTHSWRYTLTTAVTLVVNVLISIALYGLFRLPVHIYTLAGITVSLGIIIDNSIVMIDHYYRNRNKSIFPAIVTSVLTTVAALAVTILLPDAEKNELADFCKVIILNLSVSLITAHLFIPALMDRFFKQNEIGGQRLRRTRAIASFSRLYSRYVSWGTGHRWVCILIVFAAFGLPFCLIPEPDKSSKPDSGIRGFYFSNRYEIDRWLGSSFALFYKSVEKSDFYREPSRPVLTIRAGMPEGCSISQLNEVVGHMESFLARFDEIEIFETSILSPDNAELTVMFKPEYENSGFPSVLKAKVMKIAVDLGGANWRITGVDNTYFDNNIISDNREYGISISGYNFKELVRIAENLRDSLESVRRVQGPLLWGRDWNSGPLTEFILDYDSDALAVSGINPYGYWNSLNTSLYARQLGWMPVGDSHMATVLESSEKDRLDLWHIKNTAVRIDSVSVKLAGAGEFVKNKTGIPLQRVNQSYEVSVRFDFLGNREMARNMIQGCVKELNENLPVGYKAKSPEFSGIFNERKSDYFGLVLLSIAAIFVILSVYFESLMLPLSIIAMIPLSFVGSFLAFGISGIPFDRGGFASMVMLCGIVVNAGIYLLSSCKGNYVTRRDYVKAFQYKSAPIFLTVASTILGLIPFLLDGPSEVFWFDFAFGTVSGLIFSVIAIVFLLPVLAVKLR